MVPPLHSGYYVSVMGLLFQPLLLEPKSVAICGMEFLFHNTSFLWALTSIVLRMGCVGTSLVVQWLRF